MLKLYTKPRRKRIGPEACLQMAVAEHLRITGKPGMIWFHPANEGKRSAAEGAHLKRLGMLPGVADIVICMPDELPMFLELKARGERQSENQVAFQAACQASNFQYAVADNIDDALNILRKWGAIGHGLHKRRAQSAADEARRSA